MAKLKTKKKEIIKKIYEKIKLIKKWHTKFSNDIAILKTSVYNLAKSLF